MAHLGRFSATLLLALALVTRSAHAADIATADGDFSMALNPRGGTVCVRLPVEARDLAACEGIDVAELDRRMMDSKGKTVTMVALAVIRHPAFRYMLFAISSPLTEGGGDISAEAADAFFAGSADSMSRQGANVKRSSASLVPFDGHGLYRVSIDCTVAKPTPASQMMEHNVEYAIHGGTRLYAVMFMGSAAHASEMDDEAATAIRTLKVPAIRPSVRNETLRRDYELGRIIGFVAPLILLGAALTIVVFANKRRQARRNRKH